MLLRVPCLIPAANKLLEKYKIENETLRAEVADMKANGFISSRPTTSEQEELQELRSQNEVLRKQVDEMNAEQEAVKGQHAETEQRLRKREDKLEREMTGLKKAQEEEQKTLASMKIERESIVKHCVMLLTDTAFATRNRSRSEGQGPRDGTEGIGCRNRAQ